MAIAVTNKTAANNNPNGGSQTWQHTTFAGSDRTLVVVVTMANTTSFSSATYNGTAMTLVRNQEYSGQSQRAAIYILEDNDVGTNLDIVVNFTGSQFNNTSMFAFSMTGAGLDDVDASNGAVTTPNSQSLTIQENSLIYATGLSSNTQNSQYSIGGTNRPFEFSHNSNRQVRGALSVNNLSAGAQNVTTRADFGTVTNLRVAILEAGPAPSARRRIILC